MIIGDLSLALKWPGLETDHSSPSSAEIKSAWSFKSTPPYAFKVWCLIKHRGNFNYEKLIVTHLVKKFPSF
jgi:hypothetical protein